MSAVDGGSIIPVWQVWRVSAGATSGTTITVPEGVVEVRSTSLLFLQFCSSYSICRFTVIMVPHIYVYIGWWLRPSAISTMAFIVLETLDPIWPACNTCPHVVGGWIAISDAQFNSSKFWCMTQTAWHMTLHAICSCNQHHMLYSYSNTYMKLHIIRSSSIVRICVVYMVNNMGYPPSDVYVYMYICIISHITYLYNIIFKLHGCLSWWSGV